MRMLQKMELRSYAAMDDFEVGNVHKRLPERTGLDRQLSICRYPFLKRSTIYICPDDGPTRTL